MAGVPLNRLRTARSTTGTTGITTLSTGAIIGIAIGGGAIVFGVLTFMLIRLARKRHRRNDIRRTLDLDADEVTDEMRSTALSDIYLNNPPKRPIYTAEQHAQSGWVEKDPQRGPMSSEINLLPPSYHITGLRDSWPLVSLTSPLAPQMTPDGKPISPSMAEASFYAAAAAAKADLPFPQPSEQSHTGTPSLSVGASIRHSQSAQPLALPDRKRSFNRRSVSDNQLTSILRSTSQRLRDAQRRPMSRAMSVLSQVSGQPPEGKLPSPPKMPAGGSHEALVTTDQTEDYAESVKSSVLDMFSTSPSPGKMVSRSAGSGITRGRTPPAENLSDDDSMYGGATPDMVIPAALTSPSKNRVRSEQRHRMRISSAESPVSIKIRENNRTSTAAFGGRDIFTDAQGPKQRSTSNSSIPQDTIQKSTGGQSLRTRDRRMGTERKTTFGHDQPSVRSESPTLPLQTVSGNKPSPNAAFPGDKLLMHPFQWTKDTQLVVKRSPNPQKPTISKMRGHQRSKTIRLSGLPVLPRYVDALVEESESELSPKVDNFAAARNTSKMSKLIIPPKSDKAPESPISEYSKVNTSRPPSIAQFPAFLGAPGPSNPQTLSPALSGADESRHKSSPSYSATMSFYGLYSSDDITGQDTAGIPASPPRSPEQKKQFRQGRLLSISQSNPVFRFPPPDVSEDPGLTQELTSQKITTEPPSPFDGPASTDRPLFSIAPPTISRLHGPRNPPRHVPRDSMQYSVGLLRRMNSDVSYVSNAGSLGDEGSPTLPVLRGGGISPTKTGGRRPSNHYHAMGRSYRSRSRLGSPSRRYERSEKGASSNEEMLTRNSNLSEHDESVVDRPTAHQDFYDPMDDNLLELDLSEGLKIKGLRLPMRDSNGSPIPTTLTGDGVGRWSDVTPKTSPEKQTVQTSRENSLPKATTPTKWGAGWDKVLDEESPSSPTRSPQAMKKQDSMRDNGSPIRVKKLRNGIQSRRVDELRKGGMPEDENRDSLGLYDENGFLKSSPERGRPGMDNMI